MLTAGGGKAGPRRTMQFAGRLEPNVTARLPPDAVHDIDRSVGAGLLEFAQDGDDVRRVTDGREGLAGELGGIVLEHSLGRGRNVEEGALEREDMDKVVALCGARRVSLGHPQLIARELTCSNKSLLKPFLD